MSYNTTLALISIFQSPAALLFYDIDWADWLQARDIQVSDIHGFSWTATGATITDFGNQGSVARVYISGVPANRTILVTCHISAAAPDSGADLTDAYSFNLVGTAQ